MNKTPERLLCEDYVRLYPKMKKLTLAKKIYEENKGKFPRFKSVEHIRRAYINHITGSNGKFSREHSDKTLQKPLTNDTRNQLPFDVIDTGAKILLLDIETAPIRAFVWSLWKQNVGINQIQNDWFILTWAAKWLFDDKVYSAKLTSSEAIRQDDKRIMKGIWEMVNEADIVITHNGEKFDNLKLNTRFIINGFEPPLPYISIDTLKCAKRQFAFSSNKQDFISHSLGTPRKLDTGGFELWEKCYAGDNVSLAKMEEYNIGDIYGLEGNYLKMRPWIKPHPNLSLYILDTKQERCPTCGSEKLKEEGKSYKTSVGAYRLFRCGNCGASGRHRINEIKINEKRHLLNPVAR